MLRNPSQMAFSFSGFGTLIGSQIKEAFFSFFVTRVTWTSFYMENERRYDATEEK